MRYLVLLIVFSLIFFGCSTNENDPVGPEDTNAETFTLTVNAAQTYYFNLAQKNTVEITDPMIDSGWDLVVDNLTRFRLNGGSTAPGGVYAQLLENESFAELSKAPSQTFLTDTQDKEVIGENWYYYDITTHTVNPLDQFYVIRTVDGEYFKFQFTQTSFTSQTDGEITFSFLKIDAPDAADMADTHGRVQYFILPLSSTEEYYFNFKESKTVSVTDEMNSMDWDLKTTYLTVSLNGGSNGSGMGAAVELNDVSFDSLNTAPAAGYTEDAVDNPVIGDNWYTYDFMTHTVSVNPLVYVVKTASGKYAKLEFTQTDFSSQSGGIAVIRFEYLDSGMDF